MAQDNPQDLRDAFSKVKHDIYSLYAEITSIKRDLVSMKGEMSKVLEILSKLSSITQDITKAQNTPVQAPIKNNQANSTNQKETQNSTNDEKQYPTTNPTHPPLNQTQVPYYSNNPTHFPVYSSYFNKEKQPFSTGNGGVPTDRQTNQQTDKPSPSTPKPSVFQEKTLISLTSGQNTNEKAVNSTPNTEKLKGQEKPASSSLPAPDHLHNPIMDAARALDSLDSLKKEIRLKFKQLTDQEILIFSTLYQMEEEQGSADYKALALKLNLTESSIRDYVGRLLQKGIPVEKKKVNNKKILLFISPSLKRVASLPTILHLRDL